MNDLEKMRHTLSHILAAAVLELYPNAKFGIGPAINDGFYYDIDFGDTKVSDTDLPKIEKKMRGIIARKLEMKKRQSSKAEALNWAREHNQDYKIELINELPEEAEISFYDLGDLFSDLCKGPHVNNTSRIGEQPAAAQQRVVQHMVAVQRRHRQQIEHAQHQVRDGKIAQHRAQISGCAAGSVEPNTAPRMPLATRPARSVAAGHRICLVERNFC